MENESETKTETKTDESGLNKKVMVIYAAFIVVMVMQVLPSMAMQIWSLVTLGGAAAILKLLRTEHEKDAQVRNHATYLFRTMTIWTFLLGVATFALSIYMSANYDYEQLMGLIGTLTRLAAGPMSAVMADPVLHHLAMIGVACFVPPMVYLALRVLRGLFYAVRGMGLPNPKTLF